MIVGSPTTLHNTKFAKSLKLRFGKFTLNHASGRLLSLRSVQVLGILKTNMFDNFVKCVKHR